MSASRTLRIASGLELPIDVVAQSIAILARRGAGKTYTAAVLVEEVVRAGVPVCVLDPTGAWWGLRSSVDGQRAGLPVTIFGGDHGDVPLEPTAGRVIAEVVLEHPSAYIVDLSGLESKAAEQRFAADFLERLYRGKRRETGPLLLVVDEADVFAPQRPGPDQTRTLGALEAIVRRGRIKGLGDLLISQRAAVLNKNVLTQTEVLVVMQTTGPQDRAAIEEWIAGNGTRTREDRDVVLGSLASLERGEAWVWSPAFLRVLQRVRIRPRTTFDSSRTPEVGDTAVVPRTFAKVDVEALGERIRATIAQSKANDPVELRRRIAELERARPSAPEVRVERVEVPVLDGQVTELASAIADMREATRGLADVAAYVDQAADNISAALGRVQQRPQETGQTERAPRGVPASPVGNRGHTAVATLAPAAPSRESAPNGDEVRLGRAERTLLAALVQSRNGLSRAQLSLITGYSAKSGHFNNVMAHLRTLGLINRGEPIVATAEGTAAVGNNIERLPEPGPGLVAYWTGRLGLAERTLLELFVAAYPHELTREELADASGYSATSGHFNNVLSRLRTLGLIAGWRASPDLMGGS